MKNLETAYAEVDVRRLARELMPAALSQVLAAASSSGTATLQASTETAAKIAFWAAEAWWQEAAARNAQQDEARGA